MVTPSPDSDFFDLIITPIVAIVHAIYILNRGGPKIVIVALVEVSWSSLPDTARLRPLAAANNSIHRQAPPSLFAIFPSLRLSSFIWGTKILHKIRATKICLVHPEFRSRLWLFL